MSKAKIMLTEADGTEHDITDSIAFMYDAIVQSMDWGSGFLDLEEELHIASVGALAGYEVPDVVTLDGLPQPVISDFRDDAGRLGPKRYKEYEAAMDEWHAKYNIHARAEIFKQLKVFDMTDEYNPPTREVS